ncbi:MAG TPA: DUF5602 domain-containing protein [Pyrinomonadaceae bacterium]
MNTNQQTASRFESSALALLLRVDRIFLFRKTFVALALILAVSGTAFAQRSAGGRQKAGRNSANPVAVSKAKTIFGETKALGDGQVRSWVSLDGRGNPTAIGLTFNESVLSNLPKEPPPGLEGTELSLALPPEAAATAFNHVRMDWNPHGHPPEKIYDVAHFDFHFYMITEEERNGITVQGEDVARSTKAPAAEFMPEGYMYVPDSAIPRMGAHWINPVSRELHGQPFTRTLLYGSYNGNVIFVEPMIAKSFLETKTSLTEVIKLPAKYQRRAYYPTKYSVRYDPTTKEYTIALEGMTLR